MFDAGSVHDFGIQIKKRFAVREVKRRVGVNLSPDEHVFGGERYLFVPLANICADRFHDFTFWHVDLWVQVWYAELAASPASGSHLHHAEGRSLIRKKNSAAVFWMTDFSLARQNFSANRLAEQLKRIDRFAASLDDTIDSEFLKAIGLSNLPAARAP